MNKETTYLDLCIQGYELSKPTLNEFEQGKTSITLENALKILKMLGLD